MFLEEVKDEHSMER